MKRLSPTEINKLDVPAAFFCPYFHGLGTCKSGCWEEPSCQTGTPLGGWRVRDAKGRFVSRELDSQVFATLREQIAEDAR